VKSPEPRLAGASACLLAPSFRTRAASRLARERSRRASSRLTCERSLVRAPAAPILTARTPQDDLRTPREAAQAPLLSRIRALSSVVLQRPSRGAFGWTHADPHTPLRHDRTRSGAVVSEQTDDLLPGDLLPGCVPAVAGSNPVAHPYVLGPGPRPAGAIRSIAIRVASMALTISSSRPGARRSRGSEQLIASVAGRV
jgi:hypothetical protein